MEDQDESLITHLEALRSMLIRCFVALGIGLVPLFFVAPYVINLLIKVLIGENDVSFNYFSPMEVFILQIKVAVVLDFLCCFPYIARQLWQFVLPALYDNERKFIKSMVFISSALFIIGVLFCVFFILPLIISFGISFSTPDIKAMFGISNVISLSLWLGVVFGLMFQFPVVTYSLIRSEMVSYQMVKSKRSYVFVAILIIAGILTPPDIVSQLMLTIPTYLLFELGLWMARHLKIS